MSEEKKAYDIKELGNHAKAQGLELLEDGAEKLAKAVFAWLKESAELSVTPYDNMAFAVALPEIEKVAFKAIDKIDGQVG